MFTKADGPNIIAAGHKMAKKRNPVYLWKQRDIFEVETREGMLAGKPGDYLAHDPVTGDVWLVSADYAARHYEDF